MADDFNAQIINEFRANGGKMGGPFGGAPVVLLTSTGAKSGRPHTTPLVYLADGDRIVVFASMGGAPTNPAWYYNLRAHPDASIEIGAETRPVKAVITSGEERDRLFRRQVSIFPTFGEYEQKTTRTIPVVALERAG